VEGRNPTTLREGRGPCGDDEMCVSMHVGNRWDRGSIFGSNVDVPWFILRNSVDRRAEVAQSADE
jgi:hypothetical protein